jgi:hypothetical protein
MLGQERVTCDIQIKITQGDSTSIVNGYLIKLHEWNNLDGTDGSGHAGLQSHRYLADLLQQVWALQSTARVISLRPEGIRHEPVEVIGSMWGMEKNCGEEIYLHPETASKYWKVTRLVYLSQSTHGKLLLPVELQKCKQGKRFSSSIWACRQYQVCNVDHGWSLHGESDPKFHGPSHGSSAQVQAFYSLFPYQLKEAWSIWIGLAPHS